MTNENLYGFVFWYNPYNNLWYAIDKDTQLEFFNGNREKSVHYKSKEISTFIQIVGNKTLLEKMKNQDPE